jgi:hypothetical protein
MRIRSKVIEGVAGTVLVAATVFAVGSAFDSGSGGRESSATPVGHGSEVEVNAWAAGDAALAPCEWLPENYRVRETNGASGRADGGAEAWRALYAAVAGYFEDLARQCAAQPGEH